MPLRRFSLRVRKDKALEKARLTEQRGQPKEDKDIKKQGEYAYLANLPKLSSQERRPSYPFGVRLTRPLLR
ncbi:hypothetical protein PZA11_000255 [Diplocarpon coronariae]